jgi:class 3 adenylate cyclase
MLMPEFVLDRLNNYEISSRHQVNLENFVADDAGEIALMFCDVCYFDDIIKECQDQVVEVLDETFKAFDSICKQYGVQKIETVGKTYFAVAGLKFAESKLPESISQSDPIERVLSASQDFMKFVAEKPFMAGKHLVLKIGLHYGTCIFGVLGYHKPQFSLIGDSVNTTSRHCTTGDEGTINISESAWIRIRAIKKIKTTVSLC